MTFREPTNAELVVRFDSVAADRKNIEAKWNEIDRYILPLNQGNFAQTIPSELSKDWSTLDVWDSTAPIGAERLAAMLHSTLLSGRWFGAGYQSPRVNKEPKAKAWLEDTVDRMFDSIMSSNFEVRTASSFLEWVGYGNGALDQGLRNNEEWEGLEFGSQPIRNLFFEEDWAGNPYRMYKPLQYTPMQIVSKFRDPEDPSKPSKSIPEEILKQGTDGTNPGEKQEVLFVLYRREGAKMLAYDEKTRAPELRPFGWRYILRKGLVTLEQGGQYEFTSYVMRYMKPANSLWGYGPGILSLPTVRMINSLMENTVNAAAVAVNPPSLVTERGLLSDIDLTPGGQTVVRSLDDIKPYLSGARIEVSEALLSEARTMLRKFYREDDITLKDSPQMTATEVNRRFVLLNRFLSMPVKNIQYDLFGPVIQNTFSSMLRMGQLDAVPDIVQALRPRIKIEFYGPLMTAQRDDEVAAIERLLAAKAAMTKMDQRSRARFVIKDDLALREMAERLSTPASMMADEKEVEEAAQQEAQREAAMVKAQTEKVQAEGDRAQAGADQMRGEGM